MKGKAFWTIIAVVALGLAVFAIPTLARPTPQMAPTTVPAGDVSNLPEGCHGGDGLGTGGAGSFDPVTLSRIATYLGLTPQELVTRLGEGQTLAAIATAQGKTEAGLVEVLLAPYKDHLAVAVKYGYLTQAEADALYATRTQALSYQLNITPYYTPSGVAPGYGGGMLGGGGMMGGEGMMGNSMMGGGGMMGNGMMGGGGMMGNGMMGNGMMGGGGRGFGW